MKMSRGADLEDANLLPLLQRSAFPESASLVSLYQYIQIDRIRRYWHEAMLTRGLKINAFTLLEMIVGVADMGLHLTFQHQDKFFAGMRDRMGLDFALAAIDQHWLHLLADKVGSHGINGIAFVRCHKSAGLIDQVGRQRWSLVNAIFHQDGNPHPQRIGNFRKGRQRRNNFPALNLGQQAL